MKISRRGVAFVALWLMVAAGILLAPGCYGHNCDPGFEGYGVDAGQGSMVDETTWESSPIDGEWLWYPRQRVYFFDIPALGGRKPKLVVPYVSATLRPNVDPGGNSVIGAGNIALQIGAGPNRVAIKNDTCSDYYLRLVVEVPRLPPVVETDSGAEGPSDAGITDAETDAGGDASDAGDGG